MKEISTYWIDKLLFILISLRNIIKEVILTAHQPKYSSVHSCHYQENFIENDIHSILTSFFMQEVKNNMSQLQFTPNQNSNKNLCTRKSVYVLLRSRARIRSKKNFQHIIRVHTKYYTDQTIIS